ncbi:DUF1905 domain-containing protein [Thermomonas brevis]|uniref:DUF1905 domain-containing protein n=1 Tax=Thermomonas brevis TaxID=215691 RepID=A0A7G9QPN3_9GAMM|nr:YdeI/OmpD-associated family protein [Thermomonas brevis]QNN45308.1 DUF1905 domain-containing protein [Thermomonas brevis]
MAARAFAVRCKAALLKPANPKNASWRFLRLPQAASAKLPSRGMVGVDGTLDGHAFTAMLEPDGEGGHWLKVPRALREAAGVEAGDSVMLELAPAAKEPEPVVPPDLRKALADAPAALAQWKAITPAARRDFIKWLGTAKQADTRARRIRNACDMLAAGKRRICCFDRSGIYGKGICAPDAASEE